MFKIIKERLRKRKKLAKKQPEILRYEELEKRVLFSADAVPGLDTAAVEEQVIVQDVESDVQVEREAASETVEQTAEQERSELVLVNENVSDYEQLIADLQANNDKRIIEVVVLESDRDGIEQVNDILSERSDLAALHFVSHGSDGQIKLGNTWLNDTTLQQNNEAIATWGTALNETGDILFYGCNIAADSAGQSLLNNISQLTAADVAASDDPTGHVSLDGDWELEYVRGSIETSSKFSPQLVNEYQHTLATYTVSSLADSGAGTLRQAIIDANNNGGADRIEITVAGTINLSSALPAISQELTIDGSTAPGYAGNPVVNLNGSGLSGNGLWFTSNADNSKVNALMITNFTGNGIQVDAGADGISITGNWIGTTGTGTTGDGNSNNGINVQGANTIIGGTGSNDGNVITNNGNEGINLTGAGTTGTIIQGNIIGLDPDGSTGSGNGDVGIALLSGAHNTTIGGTDPNARNIISMNFEGIEINSNNNTIQGNYIGTDITGTLNRGNRSDDGIEIQSNATGNLIGGTEAGAGNLIAFNALDGINIVSGSGNAVLGNDIHSNGDLSIDLGSGVNNNQLPPVLTSAETTGIQVTISGTLNSSANSFFRIEFFGANQTYLGYANVATDGSGNATINAVLTASVNAGDLITATATKSDATYTSFTDTSEFATNISATGAASLWLTTEEDVGSPSGANGLDSWAGGSVLSFDDPNLAYHPGGTDGTLSQVFNLDNFVQDDDSRLDAVHYVGTDLTIGSNAIPLQAGDILLSSVYPDASTLSVTSRDVFIFRPDNPSDYSLGGTFIKIIDGTDLAVEIEGITLVEQTTTVGSGGGATTLNPGDFLFTDRDNDSTIFRLQPGVLGDSALNTGTVTTLVDGTDLGINQTIHGVELVESNVAIGDRILTSGQLLISLYVDDVVAGTSVSRSDIFILNVPDTGAATTATVEAFFTGGDIGFDTWQESP